MHSLVLTDTVYDIRVRAGKLIVNGYHAEGHEVEEYNPCIIYFENVVIGSTEGNITTSAIAWLARNSIPVVFLDWKGGNRKYLRISLKGRNKAIETV